MIQLVNLTKHYGKIAAVDGLNLEVPAGQIFGFLGPNGAGKTTTIRVMMGILKPSAGRVLLGGYDVERDAVNAKAISGFIPDRPFLYEKLSGAEFLEFIGKLHRLEPPRLRQRIAELLDLLELTPWKDELVESYSHGMKQRLVVCASLFLSTHSIGVAEEICHRIGIIQQGRLIACGTMAELHERAAGKDGNLESVFLELTREQITD